MIDDPRLQHAAEMEGCADHFYLDGAGYVTIGVGCRVPTLEDATNLRMYLPDDRQASTAQITADYETVRKMKPGLALKEYRVNTVTRLRDDDLVELFNERWRTIQLELESHIGPISEFPEAAQNAIMDMAFNVGASGVVNGFPNFTKAFQAQDWPTCAVECVRKENPPYSNGIQPSRNVWTVDQFKSITAWE